MQYKIQQNRVVLSILVISCIVFSCNSFLKKDNPIVSNSKEKVTIYDYQIWLSNLDKKELRDSTITYFDTMILFNRINQVFALNDSVYIDFFVIESDSFFLNNVYCPNLDTIYLSNEDEIIELKVNHYDIENSYDEEMYVYWNHDYGLVALYNYPWGALILYDRETKKGFAKNIFYNDFINRTKEKMRLMRESFEPDEYQ